MNNRLLSGLFVVAILVPATACRTASDEQRKAENAQREADTEIAQSNSENDNRNRESQAEADVKVAEARAAFIKLRDDYRQTTSKKLADLDVEIADLEAKQKTATGLKKQDLDESLTQIRTARAQYAANHAALLDTTAADWDRVTKELEAQWTALKDLVDKEG